MDCLEFRRLIGSEPRVTAAAARAHLETLCALQDAYSRAQALEARIAVRSRSRCPKGSPIACCSRS